MNEEIFDRFEALTFDDVLIVPGYTEILPYQTDVRVKLADGVALNIPVVSAAMDTVTTARMAIGLAREGGLGIIHRNMSSKEQAAEVNKVKRSESGMIVDPVTLPHTATLEEAEAVMSRYHISGVPITEEGEPGVLVGILTNRDVRFVEAVDYERPVSDFMTSDNLVTANIGTTLEQAQRILQQHRIEKLPLVDAGGRLKGLITVKDIQKKRDFPNTATDMRGRLLVGAAVGVGADVEVRVQGLRNASVDVITIDTAHGDSVGVIHTIEKIKAEWPDLPVIAGNVVTAEGAERLMAAGADVIKVGVGAGSICTTPVVTGAGMPQITAIHECAQMARKKGVSVIADGGVTYSGDIVKAIAAGADAVMLGGMLAGLKESPGEEVLYEGRLFKEYRGMGSMGAMQGYSRDRYATGKGADKLVPEGIEGRVPFKGPLKEYIYQLVGGLRSGMGYAGAATLESLRTGARLVRVSGASLIESHPHDVHVTKESPNYQAPKRS